MLRQREYHFYLAGRNGFGLAVLRRTINAIDIDPLVVSTGRFDVILHQIHQRLFDPKRRKMA